VNNSQIKSFLPCTINQLEQTPWIARGDNGGTSGFDMPEFAVQQIVGHFGLDEIIDSRAAAAPIAFP
jgi:hypothetical protein